MVLMLALNGGAEVPDCHRSRGHGCHGGGYSGCYGGGCYGGGCYGGGCYGGGYGGGYGGCHGGGYGGGCYGGGVISSGCYGGGVVSGGCYGGPVISGGCHGGVIMSGGCVGGTVVPSGGGKTEDGGTIRTQPDKDKDKDKDKNKGLDDEQSNLGSSATLVVTLPADAKLTVDEHPSHATTAVRRFTTPALETGRDFYYTLRVEIPTASGVEVVTKRVVVRAGQETQTSFAAPVATARSR